MVFKRDVDLARTNGDFVSLLSMPEAAYSEYDEMDALECLHQETYTI